MSSCGFIKRCPLTVHFYTVFIILETTAISRIGRIFKSMMNVVSEVFEDVFPSFHPKIECVIQVRDKNDSFYNPTPNVIRLSYYFSNQSKYIVNLPLRIYISLP